MYNKMWESRFIMQIYIFKTIQLLDASSDIAT